MSTLTAEIFEGDWIAQIRVDDQIQMPWDYIKARLMRQVSDQIIPAMIDSGKYHVVRLEMGKSPNYDRGFPATDYFIKARLSIAHEQRLVIPVLEPSFDVSWHGEKKTIERVCLHCGNKLIYNNRGGCSGCGAPNGGYK